MKYSLNHIIHALQYCTRDSLEPMSCTIARLYPNNPFTVLASCLLSLRCRDSVTLPVSIELFKYAQTPQEIIALSHEKLETLIYSINYYRRKTIILKEVSQDLLDRFDGLVPDALEDLQSIKGVGLKTANLVLAEAFDKPAICVDVHVHRLSNTMGIVQTKTPEQTERALRQVLPREVWKQWNRWLVMLGQASCKKNKSNCVCARCRFMTLCPDIVV